jgi:chromate reductase, NAD(P)H dehydrogenase (quinone)
MMRDRAIRVLAISGSLRRLSSNGAVLGAVARLAPADVEVSLFEGLGVLPPFNPDLAGERTPEVVRAFQASLDVSDAVLISSPEYAHGVPGVLKNALDWIVESGELIDKPVGVVNTAPRAVHARASLLETLTVMTARVVPEASLTIPLQGRALDADGIVHDPTLSALVESVIGAIVAAARDAFRR